MKFNKRNIALLIIIFIFIVTGCSFINNNQHNIEEISDSKEMIKSVRLVIDNKEYMIDLEDNETSRKFVSILPLELEMKELNGNEKYNYLDIKFPTNSYNPKTINSGDIMLYGDNCLVIFYKSFNTSYSYTKIGHINNLPDLSNENVKVEFRK